ncbi:MAG TPA: hypothetical protein VGN61_12765 [Verrucomicrobiae bacterium]
MTNQTPAPQASNAAALLASLPSSPPKLNQPAAADFLSVINQALLPKGKESTASTSDEGKEKKDAAAATTTKTATDATDSFGLLLTLLAMSAPPLQLLPKLPKGTSHAAAPAPVKEASADAPGANSKLNTTQAEPKGVPLSKMLVSPELSHKTIAPSETTSGTSAANSEPRMNIAARKNEVAGEGEQKLPPAAKSSATVVTAVTGVDPTTAQGQDSGKKSLDFSWRETPPEMVSMINLSGKTADAEVSEAAPVSSTAMPAERLEQMISQEVVTIRQTGAQTLGVSLKVDDNTQLFLQLTTQNGQIQASLRIEKGSFSALDSQWSQLQASLARQNVQLMPASSTSQFNFQQSSQQQQRHLPQQREEWQQANLEVQPVKSRQQKNSNNPNTRRPQTDWESWA